jgi:excisionase family DNA binding protein
MHDRTTREGRRTAPTEIDLIPVHPVADSGNRDPLQECARFLESWVRTQSQAHELQKIIERLSHQLDLLVKHSPSTPSANALLSIKDAAQVLSLSERTIRDRIATREWPAYQCGSAIRVDPLEIRARMKQPPR